MKWVPHRRVEEHLEAHGGGAWTVLRPGFFAQNLADGYRRDLLEDARLYVPAGEGRVTFLDVHDVGDVAAHVFAAPERYRGRYLTLTGPEALTFTEVAAKVSKALGRTIRYEPASLPGYAWHLLRRRGLSVVQTAVQLVLHAGLRRGDAELIDATLPLLLGRPARDLDTYLREAAGGFLAS